ncbi:MAG TPA: putative DNA-binding domain-containing protein [Candidatus Xenobia bacterium]|jgi:hypothetical protein
MSEDLTGVLQWAQSTIRREIEPSAEDIDAHLAPMAHMSAADALALHRQQHAAQFLGSMMSQFPHVLRFTGEVTFAGLVGQYLRDHPLRSYTPNHLKSGLPAALRAMPPFPGQAFVADLAALEVAASLVSWARVEKVLTLEQVEGQAWEEQWLVPIKASAALGFTYDVTGFVRSKGAVDHEFWTRPAPNWLLLYRPVLTLYENAIAEEEFRLLRAVFQGTPVALTPDPDWAREQVAGCIKAGLFARMVPIKT